MLTEYREVLDKIADYLYEHETITGKEFMDMFRELTGIEAEEEEEKPADKEEKPAEKETAEETVEESKDQDPDALSGEVAQSTETDKKSEIIGSVGLNGSEEADSSEENGSNETNEPDETSESSN